MTFNVGDSGHVDVHNSVDTRLAALEAAAGADGVTQAEGDARYAQRANNLADLGDAAVARSSLGLGTAATAATTAFDPAGAAAAVLSSSLQKSANLSDVSNTATARSNLGAAASSHTHAESDVASLVSDLAGKAAVSHTHTEANISNLTTDLSTLQTAKTNHESRITALETSILTVLPAGTTLTAVESGGAYTRPTSRTDIVVIFQGASDPGPVALENDMWAQTP